MLRYRNSLVAIAVATLAVVLSVDAAERTGALSRPGRTQSLQSAPEVSGSDSEPPSSPPMVVDLSIPDRIPFQGFLIDDTQDPPRPLDGVVDLTVSLYDALQNGNQVWPVPPAGPESHDGVTVRDGVFNIEIGKFEELPIEIFDGTSLWLAVSVAGDDVAPRTELLTSPFAMRTQEAEHAATADFADEAGHALTADGLVGGGSDSDWAVVQGLPGTLHLKAIPNGNVGIGTPFLPQANLHVGKDQGVVEVRIDADPNNSNEDWQPKLHLTQDGGALHGELGFFDGGNNLRLQRFSTNTGDSTVIVLRPNGVTVPSLRVVEPSGPAVVFGGEIEVEDHDGDPTVEIKGDESGGGWLALSQNTAGGPTATLRSQVASGGALLLSTSTDSTVKAAVYAEDPIEFDEAGLIELHEGITETLSVPTVEIDARKGQAGGGAIDLRNNQFGQGFTTVRLHAEEGTSDPGAVLKLGNVSGANTVVLDSQDGTEAGAVFTLFDGSHANPTVKIDAKEGTNGGGMIRLRDKDAAIATVVIDAQDGLNTGGVIRLKDSSGSSTIVLDAEESPGGPSRITTDILQVNGADLSERFDVHGQGGEVEPGMVVSIDSETPGRLKVCDRAYDRRVAGIVSGAGGVRPGMLMGQDGTVADGAHPVALTGRVYCWVDASEGAVSPGDLLTTSDTPGHARKIADPDRARGAILGKAMTGLDSGRGLVLVLVSLQ